MLHLLIQTMHDLKGRYIESTSTYLYTVLRLILLVVLLVLLRLVVVVVLVVLLALSSGSRASTDRRGGGSAGQRCVCGTNSSRRRYSRCRGDCRISGGRRGGYAD